MFNIIIYIYNIAFIILFIKAMDECTAAFIRMEQQWIQTLKRMFTLLLIMAGIMFAYDMGLRMSSGGSGTDTFLYIHMIGDGIMCLLYLQFFKDLLELKPQAGQWVITMALILLPFAIVMLGKDCSLYGISQSLAYISIIVNILWSRVQCRAKPSVHSDVFLKYSIYVVVGILAICVYRFYYYLNENLWIGFRFYANLIEDIYIVAVTLPILKHITSASKAESRHAIIKTMEDEGLQPNDDTGEEKKIQEFCRVYRLTGRESQILELILQGHSNQEISEELFISIGTVKHHIHNIFTKLEIERRSQLMRMFMEFSTSDRKEEKG